MPQRTINVRNAFKIFVWVNIYTIPFEKRSNQTKLLINFAIVITLTLYSVWQLNIGTEFSYFSMQYFVTILYNRVYIIMSCIVYTKQRLMDHNKLFEILKLTEQLHNQIFSTYKIKIKLEKCKFKINILLSFSIISTVIFMYSDTAFIFQSYANKIWRFYQIYVGTLVYYAYATWHYMGLIFVYGMVEIAGREISQLIEFLPCLNKEFSYIKMSRFQTYQTFFEISGMLIMSNTFLIFFNTVFGALVLLSPIHDNYNMTVFIWISVTSLILLVTVVLY